MSNLEGPSPEPASVDTVLTTCMSSQHASASVVQLVGMVATGLTSGLRVSNENNTQTHQGGNLDMGLEIGRPAAASSAGVPSTQNQPEEAPPPTVPANEMPPAAPANEMHLARALWVVALLTLIIVVGTALYKPAKGVVFGRNHLAYYLTLVAIFVSGVGEAFTAWLISRSYDVYRRRFLVAKVVLLASVGPFVGALSIGGFAFTQG